MNKKEFEKLKENIKMVPDEKLVSLLPKYKENSYESIITAEFVFWLIYDIEARLKELARRVMIQGRDGDDLIEIEQFVEDVFDEMMLTGKINLVEKNLKRQGDKKQFAKLISVLRELNGIRNTIFHQKIAVEEITYMGKRIGDRNTKEKMIIDIIENFTKEKEDSK